MKKLACSILLVALSGCAPQDPPAMSATQQSDFQEVIAGRTPGPAQTCVSSRSIEGNKSYGEGVIVFAGPTSSTVYVNRPPAGCPELTAFRVLRTRSVTAQLCRGDIVTVVDSASGIEYGSCSLGDFVPYRR